MIGLAHNQISRIESNAFHFTQPSDSRLSINLKDNYLSGDSFGDNAFNFVNRSTILNLEFNPRLKYLNETVFRPFLANNQLRRTAINLDGTPLDYYQENLWLFNSKSTLNLTSRISKAKMLDGIDLWDADINNFNKTVDNSLTSNNNTVT